MQNKSNRREIMKKLIGTAAAITLTDGLSAHAFDEAPLALKGNINHSVCRWCYDTIPLEDLAKAAKEMGIQSVELLNVNEFDIVKKHGLTCAMVSSINKDWGIEKGWNKKEHHKGHIEWYKYLIDETSKAGLKNLICFSGNREEDLSDEEGLENCAEGLSQIIPYAEKKKVTLVMELLNSKIDHHNYMCDMTDWGTELCRMLDSENLKLLFDIYHMQIMEGDIIRTIKDNHNYFAHYHTGGVPDRAEIDDTQELFYPAIMKTIAATGYKGFVGQEFIPKKADKLASLKQGVLICDV
ncbi:TIM barrel protein [Emticicia sp. CRIBPO]|nr:TIM barrel protein [Emticicia sp. CRIBPO]